MKTETKCSACGECRPVAAYGGWCCATLLAMARKVSP